MSDVRNLFQSFHAILRHKQIRPPMNPGVQEQLEQEVAAYLNSTADDAEPVTVEWLLAVGFSRRPIGLGLDLPTDAAVLMYDPDSMCPWWLVAGDDEIGVHAPQTRRDVRALCRCLGVALGKEITLLPRDT